MSELDEIEHSARRHLGNLLAIYGRLPPTQGSGDILAYDLARIILAVLPVVKAAEELAPRVEGTGDWACAECRPYSDMLHINPGFRCRPHALQHAISKMREELK